MFRGCGEGMNIIKYLLILCLPFLFVFCKSAEIDIFEAAKNGNVKQIEKLLLKGVNVNILNDENKSLMDIAIETRNFEIIRLLVNAGADQRAVYRYEKHPGMSHWFEYYTYFTWAVEDGDIELVKFFIELGANINEVASFQFGETPILTAIRNGDIEIVELLINEGANLEVFCTYTIEGENRGNESALSHAFRADNQDIIDLILNQNQAITADDLVRAIQAKADMDIIRKMLARVSDINNSAPLVFAVINQDEQLIKLLLENGADINNSIWGYTPLIVASFTNLRMCELIINAGADIKKTSEMGSIWTPLHHAAYMDRSDGSASNISHYIDMNKENMIFSPAVDIVRFLIAAGADVNSVTEIYTDHYYQWSEGITPLMLAKNENITRELIRAGANINAQDASGRTALMYSVFFNQNFEQVKMLIEAGARINTANVHGRTALMFARVNQAKEYIDAYFPFNEKSDETEKIINYLIRNGAVEPNNTKIDWDGYMVFMYSEGFFFPDR